MRIFKKLTFGFESVRIPVDRLWVSLIKQELSKGSWFCVYIILSRAAIHVFNLPIIFEIFFFCPFFFHYCRHRHLKCIPASSYRLLLLCVYIPIQIRSVGRHTCVCTKSSETRERQTKRSRSLEMTSNNYPWPLHWGGLVYSKFPGQIPLQMSFQHVSRQRIFVKILSVVELEAFQSFNALAWGLLSLVYILSTITVHFVR